MLNQSCFTRRHCSREDKSPDWQQRLPLQWRAMVVGPLRFALHREYEVAASRMFGYDEDERPCYYHHQFHLDAPRTDDGEDFYAALVYGEEVEAWRLVDGRWLVWKAIAREEDEGIARGFFQFSQEMPR